MLSLAEIAKLRAGTKEVMVTAKLIPLTDAAIVLSASYNQTLRLVLLGELRGQRVHGRWMVDDGDIGRVRELLARKKPPRAKGQRTRPPLAAEQVGTKRPLPPKP